MFAFGDFRPARSCQEILGGVALDANITVRVAILDGQMMLHCDAIPGGVHLYADAMNLSYPFGLYHTDKRLQGQIWWAWYRHEWASNLGMVFGYASTAENRNGINKAISQDSVYVDGNGQLVGLARFPADVFLYDVTFTN